MMERREREALDRWITASDDERYPDPRDRDADPGPWEDEPRYCYDERHELPCPLPCRACAEECEPDDATEAIADHAHGSPDEYDDAPVLSFEDEARAGLGLPPSWRDPDRGRE